ncbi:hypothetical protein [uncultured Amphritea sp.]|uniref:hypothetical protein n=1 Tax=uncultured Amphritea sp. TaxID=981605 RepID=UPI0026097ECA|nr:hypothetical protein [uncultured Amphritea sp.]
MTEDLVKRVKLKFNSGNSIRVERAIITHDEMQALLDYVPDGMVTRDHMNGEIIKAVSAARLRWAKSDQILDGMVMVPVDLLTRVTADAHDSAYGALQEHDRALGRTTNKNRRTAEEYEHQMKDAELLEAMIKAAREK